MNKPRSLQVSWEFSGTITNAAPYGDPRKHYMTATGEENYYRTDGEIVLIDYPEAAFIRTILILSASSSPGIPTSKEQMVKRHGQPTIMRTGGTTKTCSQYECLRLIILCRMHPRKKRICFTGFLSCTVPAAKPLMLFLVR
ncbi:MAG: hypothetical protein WC586_04290 [Methanoregula sp.]